MNAPGCDPLLLDGVTKGYRPGAPPAVRDATLSVRQGEIMTLLGPSGCGKTTTLRLIAGFERPDAGEILIHGRVVAGPDAFVPAEQRGVGMVFQDYALFPHLTVGENVGFGLWRRSPDARRARVREVLELVGLSELAPKYPHELSGGEQQRVALARALAPRPHVLLLDEPFSNLDANLRYHVRAQLRRILKAAGSTAVMVTHDRGDALAIADRIAVMRGGEFLQVGTPREIFQFPDSEFVARFMGRANLLPGVMGREPPSPRNGEGWVVRTVVGSIPCDHTHGHPPGAQVTICVRPDGFALDPGGPLAARVVSVVYAGHHLELTVHLVGGRGDGFPLVIHAHPQHSIAAGDTVRFRALPNFAAVID